MNKNVVYLTGFMASGKSTYGRILANVMGWDFYDLDKVIVESEGKEVVDIFAEQGEKYFREVETKTLERISNYKNAIVSLGGGTIINEHNLKICKETGLLIYLKVPEYRIFERIKRRTTRPLFRDLVLEGKHEEIKKKIHSMLSEREPYYLKADIVIRTDKQSMGKTIDFIHKQIKKNI